MAPAAAAAALAGRRRRCLLLLALALALATTTTTTASPTSSFGSRTCANDRVSGGVSHAYCGLPYAAANFQSYFLCEEAPAPLAVGGNGLDEPAIAQAVAAAPAVRAQRGVAAVGEGDAQATFQYVRVDRSSMSVTCPAGLSQRALLRALDHWDEIEEAYNNDDEEEHGGLLLAKAKHALPPSSSTPKPRRRLNSPDGLTLEAFSWFIDQTMGGAASTASHGSSFRFGSLSSQLRAGRFVLANGTVLAASRPAASSVRRWPDPRTATFQQKREEYLWRALSVSTGRLGVLTEVTMDVAKNERRVRTSVAKKPDAFFLGDVQALADRYAAAVVEAEKQYPNDSNARNEAVWRSVRDYDETQAFFFVPSRKAVVVHFEREGGMTPAEWADAQREAGVLGNGTADSGPPDVRELSADDDANETKKKKTNNNNATPPPSPPPPPSYAAVAKADVAAAANAAASDRNNPILRSLNPAGPMPAIERAPKTWSLGYEAMLSSNSFNATLPARAAYLSCSEIESALHISVNAYDQYEVALPLKQLAKGTCMPLLMDTLYSPSGPQAWRAFRAPALVRFVAGERPFLSPSNDVGPVVYVNLEDHISYALGGGQGRTAEERERAAGEAKKAAQKGKTPEQSRAGSVESPLMRNPGFDAVMRVLRGPECRGRLHWGKAGWPLYASLGAGWGDDEEEGEKGGDGAAQRQQQQQQQQLPSSCFDGAAEYGKSWCEFGCATAELDPTGKFEPEAGADVWWFGGRVLGGGGGGSLATTSGANGNLGASDFARECCGPLGFLSDRCKCVRRAEAGGAATCRSEKV